MDESCSYKHPCTEVLAEEESVRRNLHPLDLLSNDGESGAADTGKKHKNYVRKLVCALIAVEIIHSAAVCNGRS